MDNDKFNTFDVEALPANIKKMLATKRDADALAREARNALETAVTALMARNKHFDPNTETVLYAYNWGNFAFKVVDKSEVKSRTTGTKREKFRL